MGLTVVAMSGGVDSSVAALLVTRQGPAFGLTMKLRDPDTWTAARTCCTIDDAHDARAVCEVLGIAHWTLDLREEFRLQVIDDFIAEYLAGRTPNPCVRCNTFLKWDALWNRAREAGAERIATGHYARIVEGPEGPELHRGQDPIKDQAYFLWGIPQHLLGVTDFPLGSLTKSDTRTLARDAGLPTATKFESQDICFVPGGDRMPLLRGAGQANSPALLEGPVIDIEGRSLGRHPGLAGFTVGQRRGTGISGGKPLHVVRLEPDTRTLVLGRAEDLLVDTLEIGSVNLLASLGVIESSEHLTVQVRHRSSPLGCHIENAGAGGLCLRLHQPAPAPAPGQSMVVFAEDRVLGGGVLRAAWRRT